MIIRLLELCDTFRLRRRNVLFGKGRGGFSTPPRAATFSVTTKRSRRDPVHCWIREACCGFRRKSGPDLGLPQQNLPVPLVMAMHRV